MDDSFVDVGGRFNNQGPVDIHGPPLPLAATDNGLLVMPDKASRQFCLWRGGPGLEAVITPLFPGLETIAPPRTAKTDRQLWPHRANVPRGTSLC